VCAKKLSKAWVKTKSILKKGGKVALSAAIPVAISLVTGAIGLPVALTPLIAKITTSLHKRNIVVDESEITEVFTDGINDGLSEKLVDMIKPKNDISKKELLAVMDSVLRPELNEINSFLEIFIYGLFIIPR
jgi:hypothetical protein